MKSQLPIVQCKFDNVFGIVSSDNLPGAIVDLLLLAGLAGRPTGQLRLWGGMQSLPLLMQKSVSADGQLTDTDLEVDRLINAARDGQPNAYRELVQRFQPIIAQQMQRFSRDRGIHEDLTHDVFVEAFLSLRNFRGEAPFLHWLRRIAVRVGYRFWKQNYRSRQLQTLTAQQWNEIASFKPQDQIDATVAADLVSVLLSQMTPTDRLVLTLIYLDGCSIAETADRCRWTKTGTKLRAFRARKRLSTLIEKNSSDETQ